MRNETERIFNAPWCVVEEPDQIWVEDADRHTLLCEMEIYGEEKHKPIRKNMKRFRNIPKLYDALMYAVKDKCSNCGFSVATNPVDFCKSCKYKEFSELLEDVRKGK